MALLPLFQVFMSKAWWWSESTETCSLHENNMVVLNGIWVFVYLVLEARWDVLRQVNSLLLHLEA
jgi:hypothetical protein